MLVYEYVYYNGVWLGIESLQNLKLILSSHYNIPYPVHSFYIIKRIWIMATISNALLKRDFISLFTLH